MTRGTGLPSYNGETGYLQAEFHLYYLASCGGPEGRQGGRKAGRQEGRKAGGQEGPYLYMSAAERLLVQSGEQLHAAWPC